MSTFKIGDRARVYGPVHGLTTMIIGHSLSNIFTVIELDGPNLKVRSEQGMVGWAHPKQCRLIKKKERRRVWVRQSSIGEDLSWEFSLYRPTVVNNERTWIEFVEVSRLARKKDK